MNMENAIVKARLLGAVKFIRQHEVLWCFYDAEGWLRLNTKITAEPWMPPAYTQGSMNYLRKTYERSTRTCEGAN